MKITLKQIEDQIFHECGWCSIIHNAMIIADASPESIKISVKSRKDYYNKREQRAYARLVMGFIN